MKDFLQFLGKFLFAFFSGFGSSLMANAEFLVGILAIAMIIYIIYILFSEETDKAQRIVTSLSGLVGGVVAAASLDH